MAAPNTTTVQTLTREIARSALHLAQRCTPAKLARLEDELRMVLLRLEDGETAQRPLPHGQRARHGQGVELRPGGHGQACRTGACLPWHWHGASRCRLCVARGRHAGRHAAVLGRRLTNVKIPYAPQAAVPPAPPPQPAGQGRPLHRKRCASLAPGRILDLGAVGSGGVPAGSVRPTRATDGQGLKFRRHSARTNTRAPPWLGMTGGTFVFCEPAAQRQVAARCVRRHLGVSAFIGSGLPLERPRPTASTG